MGGVWDRRSGRVPAKAATAGVARGGLPGLCRKVRALPPCQLSHRSMSTAAAIHLEPTALSAMLHSLRGTCRTT